MPYPSYRNNRNCFIFPKKNGSIIMIKSKSWFRAAKKKVFIESIPEGETKKKKSRVISWLKLQPYIGLWNIMRDTLSAEFPYITTWPLLATGSNYNRSGWPVVFRSTPTRTRKVYRYHCIILNKILELQHPTRFLSFVIIHRLSLFETYMAVSTRAVSRAINLSR